MPPFKCPLFLLTSGFPLYCSKVGENGVACGTAVNDGADAIAHVLSAHPEVDSGMAGRADLDLVVRCGICGNGMIDQFCLDTEVSCHFLLIMM